MVWDGLATDSGSEAAFSFLAAFCYLLLPASFSYFPPSLSTLSGALTGFSIFFHSTGAASVLASSFLPSAESFKAYSSLVGPALIAWRISNCLAVRLSPSIFLFKIKSLVSFFFSRKFYLLFIFIVTKLLALLTSCCWEKVNSSLSGFGSSSRA